VVACDDDTPQAAAHLKSVSQRVISS
jgi:hypothetical protein